VYSVDALLGLTSVWTPAVAWTALGLGATAGAANLAIRQSAAVTA
jgi:hypothetical protein